MNYSRLVKSPAEQIEHQAERQTSKVTQKECDCAPADAVMSAYYHFSLSKRGV